MLHMPDCQANIYVKMFHGTGVVITDSGKHHLGSALQLGTEEFLNMLCSKQGFYIHGG